MKNIFLPLIACAIGLCPVPAMAVAYEEPRDTTPVDTEAWERFTAPLEFTWASKDVHYSQFAAPAIGGAVKDTTVTAWRGERIGVEALLIATQQTDPLKVKLSELRKGTHKVKDAICTAGFMRYVLTTHYNTCGYPKPDLPAFTNPDMIDLPDASVSLEARSVRPVWCTFEIPRDIEPGVYTSTLSLTDAKGRTVSALDINIDVDGHTLPVSHDYAFYLDMWQQPYAISRYAGVKPWSEEHFNLLKPYADMLARAGQKTVSVILFYEPWGEQSNDKFEPMVLTTKKADGSWAYDYSIMDSYIEFMAQHGVDANISCFTMIPWDMNFRYFDEAKGDYSYLKTTTTSPEYEALWTDFLQNLVKHLKEKGWYEKSMIVMDERGLGDMLNAYNIAQKAVPGIKMSLAGNYHPELVDKLESYTVAKGDFFPDDVLAQRKANGWTSLLYVCCAQSAPNIFSNSEPADGAYLPVYSTATGFDGFLHWSYTNWTDDPMTDTRFHMFAPGDTYFVYPGGRSSSRYERLVEGVQMSEKIRLLRDELTAAGRVEALRELEDALTPVRTGAMTRYYPTSKVVNSLAEKLDKISRSAK
ncbi:MAG: DUF4091 domain-containing protein [Muribaculaceae bacterium]|nr:DUF4091 domain-containing protein [Muribaculaceae bacterium]